MSDADITPATGRPPRDDRFLFGDPGEAHPAPEVFAGLQPRHPEIDPESQPSGEWAQRTVRGGLPLLMTGTLAAGGFGASFGSGFGESKPVRHSVNTPMPSFPVLSASK